MDPRRDRDKSQYIKGEEHRHGRHNWWKWLIPLLAVLAALWAWSQWAGEDHRRGVDEQDREVIEEQDRDKDRTDRPETP